jgi:hypothetical protein
VIEADQVVVQAPAQAGATSQRVGSPEVRAAFRLGWSMGLLYTRRVPDKPQPRGQAPVRLPGMSDLRQGESIDCDLAAIAASIGALSRGTADTGVALPSVADAQMCFAKIGEDGAVERFRLALFELHVGLLRSLTAAGPRLGDAYDLGRALAELSRLPAGRQLDRLAPQLTRRLRQPSGDGAAPVPPTVPELHTAWLRERFGRHRISSLCARLADLSSALPDHTGGAVASSLELFGRQVRDATRSAPAALNWDRTTTTLERQGRLWRSLLTGDKSIHDVLKPQDYVTIARCWFATSKALLWAYLKHFWWLALVVALLLLIAVAAAALGSSAGGAVAGVAAALSALGLGARSTQATLGRVAGELSRPLWDGEVEAVLAQTITQPLAADD